MGMGDKFQNLIRRLSHLRTSTSSSVTSLLARSRLFIDKYSVIRRMYQVGILFVFYLIYHDIKIYIQLEMVNQRIIERTKIFQESMLKRKNTILSIAKEEGL